VPNQVEELSLNEIRSFLSDADERLREVEERLGRIEEEANGSAVATGGKKPHKRQALPDEPLIAFVHIPKTAGGTVTSMFSAAYSKKGINKTGNYISGPEKTLAKATKRPGGWEDWHRGGGRVAIGHTPYGVFHERMPDYTRYITFLREPVDRVISHYYRHVHNPALSGGAQGTRPRAACRDAAGSLEEALVEMRLPQLNNLATRFLCTHPSLGQLPDSALDEAKENLRTFMLVGIQERFEESVILLQRALGLGIVPTRDRHISAPGDRPTVEELPADQRALLEEYNAFDVELYKFGLELFAEQAAAVGDGLAAEAQKLREANVTAAAHHEAAVQAMRDWLDHELPPDTSKPVSEVVAEAEAAGFTRAAYNQARKDMLLRKDQGEDGVWTLSRPDADHYEALKKASDWLDHELPVGTTMPASTLHARAEAAGVTQESLNKARKLMGVAKTVDADQQMSWTRPDEDAG
jgi:hypothetical protein